MTKYETIIADRNAARRAGETSSVVLFNTLLGEIQNQSVPTLAESKKAERVESETPTDVQVNKVVRQFVNNLENMIQNRDNEQDKIELEFYQTYMPKLLTEEQIADTVAKVLETYDPSQGPKIKVVMDYMKTNFEGLYDGGLVRKFIG